MDNERSVLLTGAAGGLGRVMAKALAGANYRLALVDNSQSGLEKLTVELGQAHPDAELLTLPLDLADDFGFAAAIARIEEKFGWIDVLINNAGIFVSAIREDFRQRPLRFWEIDAETLKRFFRINAIAPMILCIQAGAWDGGEALWSHCQCDDEPERDDPRRRYAVWRHQGVA